jgi:ABC-type multidrug transport system fused ATPase/permease subunit
MRGVGASLVRIRRVAELLRPYRLRAGAATAAIALATLATLAPPYLAGRAIDDVIHGASTEQLDEIVLVMVGALVLGWLALYAQTYLIEWVGQHALRDLRTRLFAHVQTLSISYFNRHSAGTLISRLTNNVETLDQLVTDGVSALVTSVVTIVGAVVVLFVLDLELALVTTGVIPLLAAGTWIYSRLSAPIYHAALDSIATVTENLEESMSGARVVRAFAQEQRHERAFDAVNGQNREVNERAINLIVLYLPFVQLISIGSIALVAVYGGFQVMDGDQSLGIVVSFIGYLRLALSPLPQIGTLFTLYQQGSAALDQSFELLAEKPDVIEHRGARELPAVRGEVEFDHVDFAYDPGRQVLSDVSFKVAPDTTVAIVGSTGSGKTTLINLLPRFYDPTRGRVLVDGADVREVDLSSLRRQIGLVPQEALLFTGSVRSNIAFGAPDASDAEIEEAARRVGVLDALQTLPDGLETEVGERGTSLSAGQRQLVALARASLTDPRIVILDEATSGIDVGTEGRIREALNRLLAGRTALIVAHRLETIRGADLIVALDAGRIVEQGSHEELVAAGGAYARLYREWTNAEPAS